MATRREQENDDDVGPDGLYRDELTAVLALRLRKVREARGLSQEGLGERTGLGRIAVNHFERARRMPKVKTMIVLCKALQCSSDYLLGLTRRMDLK